MEAILQAQTMAEFNENSLSEQEFTQGYMEEFLEIHPQLKDMTLGFNWSMGYKERYILCHCMTFCSYWVQGLAIKMGQE